MILKINVFFIISEGCFFYNFIINQIIPLFFFWMRFIAIALIFTSMMDIIGPSYDLSQIPCLLSNPLISKVMSVTKGFLQSFYSSSHSLIYLIILSSGGCAFCQRFLFYNFFFLKCQILDVREEHALFIFW